MASNSFGNLLRITTWGESHGKAIGVVIDGCPAGLKLSEQEIQIELDRRRPGQNAYTSPRQECDQVEILSGVLEGHTTGTPISLIIYNQKAESKAYTSLKNVLRPGHANFTYLAKYGTFDHRGGGRASGRETACRVAAGAIAKQILRHFDIEVVAFIKALGDIELEEFNYTEAHQLKNELLASPIFCPHAESSQAMMRQIEQVKTEGDSLGGLVEMIAFNLPVGLGDPIYEKLEANLAKAMLSIPASKAFEIGSGMRAACMKGSEQNDPFVLSAEQEVITRTNHAGGTLGGISTGMPLVVRVAFKPPSSIRKAQETLTLQGEKTDWKLSEEAKHDPCITVRAVPVVEAMGALVLADALLMQRIAKL